MADIAIVRYYGIWGGGGRCPWYCGGGRFPFHKPSLLVNCQNRTEAEISEVRKRCGKLCGKISENRRDVASTYVLRPRLGIKCPKFRMVREKDLE